MLLCYSSGMQYLSITETGPKSQKCANDWLPYGGAPSGFQSGGPYYQTSSEGLSFGLPSGPPSDPPSEPPSGGPPSGPPGPYNVKRIEGANKATEGTLELKNDILSFRGKGQEPINWQLRVLRR